MASDFKPATDRSLADLNRANRDAWDSGEFRHGDVHPKGGSQQVAGESGEVIIHAHDEEDRAVYLPRTAKRTWKNGVWS